MTSNLSQSGDMRVTDQADEQDDKEEQQLQRPRRDDEEHDQEELRYSEAENSAEATELSKRSDEAAPASAGNFEDEISVMLEKIEEIDNMLEDVNMLEEMIYEDGTTNRGGQAEDDPSANVRRSLGHGERESHGMQHSGTHDPRRRSEHPEDLRGSREHSRDRHVRNMKALLVEVPEICKRERLTIKREKQRLEREQEELHRQLEEQRRQLEEQRRQLEEERRERMMLAHGPDRSSKGA